MDIVRSRPKGTFTALRRVYKVKKNLYIYNLDNFLPYPMWDIINLMYLVVLSLLSYLFCLLINIYIYIFFIVIFGLLDITCGRIKDGMIYPIS